MSGLNTFARLWRTLVLVIGGVCVAFSATAQNLLITDYRVPISSAKSLRVNFQYDYKRLGSQEVDNRGNFFANYKYFYDSLPFAYSVEATGNANKAGNTELYSLTSNENVRAFVWGNLFIGGGLRRRFRTDDDATANALASVGYGRFINATPLAKAVRMEDWLLDLAQVRDDLPLETMIELAQIIQRESEFRDEHGERYRPEWFKAMEETVRRSGFLQVPELDAVALLRMDEVLTRERIFDRFYGWEISAGASSQILDGTTVEPSNEAFEGSFRWSRPLGWHTQFNTSARVTSPVGEDFGDAYTVDVKSDLSYEVSDRVDLLISHDYLRTRSRPANSPLMPFAETTSNSLQGSFIFFVENSLTLNLNGVLNSTDGRLQRAVTMTFGYRLF